MSIDGWELDYSFSQRGGLWTEFTDVMLVGISQSSDDNGLLQQWLNQQLLGWAYVDGGLRRVAYCGGVQAYCECIAGAEHIFLHSKGQDAFDSLSHYSQVISDFVQSCDSSYSLTWCEARHDRCQHQLLLV